MLYIHNTRQYRLYGHAYKSVQCVGSAGKKVMPYTLNAKHYRLSMISGWKSVQVKLAALKLNVVHVGSYTS
jgi:hypothetical protein